MDISVTEVSVREEGAPGAPLADMTVKFSHGGWRFWLWQNLIWPLLTQGQKEILLKRIVALLQMKIDGRFDGKLYRIDGRGITRGSIVVSLSVVAGVGAAYKFVKDYKALRENIGIMVADIKAVANSMDKLVERFMRDSSAVVLTGRSRDRELRDVDSILHDGPPPIIDIEALVFGGLADATIWIATSVAVGIAVSSIHFSGSFGASRLFVSVDVSQFTYVSHAAGIFAIVIGGYVTARNAERAELLNAFILGCVAGLCSLLSYADGDLGGTQASELRLWVEATSVGLQLPGAIVGGYFGAIRN